jgi:hypothetical protein
MCVKSKNMQIGVDCRCYVCGGCGLRAPLPPIAKYPLIFFFPFRRACLAPLTTGRPRWEPDTDSIRFCFVSAIDRKDNLVANRLGYHHSRTIGGGRWCVCGDIVIMW